MTPFFDDFFLDKPTITCIICEALKRKKGIGLVQYPVSCRTSPYKMLCIFRFFSSVVQKIQFLNNTIGFFVQMNYPALKGGVSDFSLKNLSLDRKLSILRGFIPRNLCIGKKFALKGGVLHPRVPINRIIRNSGFVEFHFELRSNCIMAFFVFSGVFWLEPYGKDISFHRTSEFGKSDSYFSYITDL